MSLTTRKQLSDLFTVLVLILTTFQGIIPTMPIPSPSSVTLVSAVVMFLVTGLTAWKQYLSVDISNAAMTSMLVVAVIATLGGLNDLFSVIHFGSTAGQWIRFSVTAVTMILNVLSKTLWPAPQQNFYNSARI
jgi:hypothetical protein